MLCIDHQIALIRLPPHISHVLQLLNVRLFGPLKMALSIHQDKIFRLQTAKIRKFEWIVAYVQARKTAFRSENVLGGWRKAGLILLDPNRVLSILLKVRPTKNS